MVITTGRHREVTQKEVECLVPLSRKQPIAGLLHCRGLIFGLLLMLYKERVGSGEYKGVYGSGNDVNRIQIVVTLCERITRPHVCQKLKTELLVDIYFEKLL